MDVDIGNLLYIIITLVALSLGLLGRKKKKPGQTVAGETGGTGQPGFLENLEKVLSGLGQEEQTREESLYFEPRREEEPVTETEEEPMEEAVPYASFYDEWMAHQSLYDERRELQTLMNELPSELPSNTELEGMRDNPPLEIIELEEEAGGVDYFHVIGRFNARKAIVYSAIINRIDY